MRSIFSSVQLISLYLVVNLTFKYLDCQHSCELIDLKKERKPVLEGDWYRYSHYYYYSEAILLNQSSPIVSKRFVGFYTIKEIAPQFTFKFFGNDVTTFKVHTGGVLEMYGEKNLGAFDTYVTGNFEVDSEVWSDNESLAVKWSFHTSDKNTRLTFIVTTLIHSNGKILFYYEGISKGIKEMQRQLTFRGEIPCGNQNNRRISVFVPGRWIRNGTLVEYEFLGDCPKRNSIEECQDAKSSNEMCIWCESAHMCVTSNDNDIRDFKLNGCRVKNNLNVDAPSESTLNKQEKTNEELTEADLGNDSKKTTEKSGPHLTISNVSVLSKPTLIKQEVNTQAITETDLRNESMITTKTTESYLMISNVSVSRDSTFNKQKEIPKEIVETDLKNQNLTTETAEDNEQRKLLQYVHTIMPLFLLYIVTPIVVSFIVIGSGCILFLWLYRRKENDF